MRRRIVVIISVAILTAIVATFVWRPWEPRYQGKTLTTWLKELDPLWPFDPGDSNEDAKEAIRYFGTNALPFLVDELRSEDSSLTHALAWLDERQSFIAVRPTLAVKRHKLAATALEALGPACKPILPSLIAILNGTNESENAAVALARVGPEALPAFATALTNQNSDIRGAALMGLGRMGGQAETAVPAIINCLEDNNRYVRWVTAQSLGSIHRRLDISIPALVNCLDDQDKMVRAEADKTLISFGPEAKSAVPVLFNHFKQFVSIYGVSVSASDSIDLGRAGIISALIVCLKDTNTWVRYNSLRVLGCCGDEAKSAIPALLDMLEDENCYNRDAARTALKNIDPESAAKAGVL